MMYQVRIAINIAEQAGVRPELGHFLSSDYKMMKACEDGPRSHDLQNSGLRVILCETHSWVEGEGFSH